MFNGTTAEDLNVMVSKKMLLDAIESYREAGGRVEHGARKQYLVMVVNDLIHERDALKITIEGLVGKIRKDRVAFDDQAREFRRLKTEHAPLVQERNALKAAVIQLVQKRNSLQNNCGLKSPKEFEANTEQVREKLKDAYLRGLSYLPHITYDEIAALIEERDAFSDSWEQERNITDSLALQRSELKLALEDRDDCINKLREQIQTLRDALERRDGN